MPRGASPKRTNRSEKTKKKAAGSASRSKSRKASSGRTRSRASSGRGFASMSSTKQRAIASEGGRAAHEQGTAHEFTSAEARAAGQKGGRRVSRNRRHMAEIDRKGGES
ncbi:MAG TPA: KGG domain-containing protein [Candidatus Dormibacteraeota bacterium]